MPLRMPGPADGGVGSREQAGPRASAGCSGGKWEGCWQAAWSQALASHPGGLTPEGHALEAWSGFILSSHSLEILNRF